MVEKEDEVEMGEKEGDEGEYVEETDCGAVAECAVKVPSTCDGRDDAGKYECKADVCDTVVLDEYDILLATATRQVQYT